ncbi:MAG: hypothetical protein AAGH74_14690 [Pseudomonadota bacterium]
MTFEKPALNLKSVILGSAIILGVAASALPEVAEAGPRSHRVSKALDTVAQDIYSLRDLRGPYRRDAEIQRLQEKLDRLEYRTYNHRGRKARRNFNEIQALRSDLSRIEARNNRRITRLEREAYLVPTPEPDVVYIENGPRFGLEISRDGVRLGIER